MKTTLTPTLRREAMRTAGREMAACYRKPVPFIGLMVLGSVEFRREFTLWCVAVALAPHPATYPKN